MQAMATNGTVTDPFRIGKAYTIGQAAKFAGVSAGTVRNWLYGLSAPNGYQMQPVFGEAKPRDDQRAPMVSFLDLSELIVAAKFRKNRIKLPRIRAAHDEARTRYSIEYPFAHLELTTLGGHILHILREFEEAHPDPSAGRFVVLSAPNQYVLPGIVQDEVKRFDYSKEDSFAERWYPYGRSVPIVVDPHYAAGRPTIAGSGVSVEIVRKRWKAGERVGYIAHDFRLKRADVELALQHAA